MDVPFRNSVQMNYDSDELPKRASSIFGRDFSAPNPEAGQPNFLAKFDKPI
jgi:hypothetical protein